MSTSLLPIQVNNFKKNIIIDVRKIKCESNSRLKNVLDVICQYNGFEIVEKLDFGNIVTYILTDLSYITISLFPGKRHVAFDLNISRDYENNECFETIFDFLVQAFDGNLLWSNIEIIDRKF